MNVAFVLLLYDIRCMVSFRIGITFDITNCKYYGEKESAVIQSITGMSRSSQDGAEMVDLCYFVLVQKQQSQKVYKPTKNKKNG